MKHIQTLQCLVLLLLILSTCNRLINASREDLENDRHRGKKVNMKEVDGDITDDGNDSTDDADKDDDSKEGKNTQICMKRGKL